MPGLSPVTVALVPVPVVRVPPGVCVSVHVPVAGSPFSTTPPVAIVQVGCVIGPVPGAAGVGGCAFITTLTEAVEIQPDVFVTVKE